MAEERLSYEAAGVSLAVAESVVDRLRTAVESTGAAGFGSTPPAQRPAPQKMAAEAAIFRISCDKIADQLRGCRDRRR